MSIEFNSDYKKALAYAARAHHGQMRKDGKTPYIVHPMEVAMRLLAAGAPRLAVMTGILHDTVEDTDMTCHDIAQEFGADVAATVLEVTDGVFLTKWERRKVQLETVASKCLEARMVRIADKAANVSDMIAFPPVGWDEEKAEEYVAWAAKVAAAAAGDDPLSRDFYESIKHLFEEAYWLLENCR